MSEHFKVRPYDAPACATDVLHPHPMKGIVEPRDEVGLRVIGAPDNIDVWIRVSSEDDSGSLVGIVERGSVLGARGDVRFQVGQAIHFHEQHVFQLIKGAADLSSR